MIDFSLTSYCVHTGFSIIRIGPFLNLALGKTLGHNMFLKVFIMILLFVLDFVYHSYLYFISNSLSSTHSHVFCGLDNVTGITILTNPYWISAPPPFLSLYLLNITKSYYDLHYFKYLLIRALSFLLLCVFKVVGPGSLIVHCVHGITFRGH